VSGIIKLWNLLLRVRPWIHDSQCTTVRWREACSAWWVPDPSGTKACGQFKPWGIVAWARSVWRIPQSSQAQVNHVLLLSLSPFSPATLNWESCHTKQGHLPPSSSIDWLGCHSNRQGRRSLWTLPVPGKVVHCDITTKSFLIGQTAWAILLTHLLLHTPATLVPVSGKSFWSEDG
jgi:hypothetical protein